MISSRHKAQKAQTREVLTIHEQEKLSSMTKSAITITNYLGGLYHFTVDEFEAELTSISLIESKHSKSSIIPSKPDIKDGLLKMILYVNLNEVSIKYGTIISAKPILKLTSPYVQDSLDSNSLESLKEWCQQHKMKHQSTFRFLQELFEEAIINTFLVKIEKAG